MMKRFATAAVAGAALVLQATAFAGAVFSGPVQVSSRSAYGALRTARDSANTNEFIGCSVYGTTQAAATTYVACSARDAAGNAFYCATYSPASQMVQAALAVSASSSLIINSDANGNCTYIYVLNNSGYL